MMKSLDEQQTEVYVKIRKVTRSIVHRFSNNERQVILSFSKPIKIYPHLEY